jgi:hypothetical protein
MASDGMIYIASFMTIGSEIQIILMLLYLNNFIGCNVGITEGGEFMKYAAEMASGGII